MPNFKYKVINKNGQKLEEIYFANTEDEVVAMLREHDYYILNIVELIEGTKIELGNFQTVKTKDIAVFSRQFSTMLSAGSNITNCLYILGQQMTNSKLKESIKAVDENIRKGLTLSEAMKRQEGVFPELFVNMIESGEASGNLDVIMKRMAEHYEKENKLNNKIKSAMVYPTIIGIFATSVVLSLLTFVMPQFIDMFAQNNVDLPGPTKVLMTISTALTTRWYLFVFGIIALIVAVKYYGKTKNGRYFFDKIKLKIPYIKSFNEKLTTSRFTRTLSILLASGINLNESLTIVSRVVTNKILEEKILLVKEQVMKGSTLSDMLKEVNVFPLMLCSMVKIGEESGSLDEILEKTADFYDEELETSIQKLTSILEPLIMIGIGIVVGFMIISIIMPMLTMYKNM